MSEDNTERGNAKPAEWTWEVRWRDWGNVLGKGLAAILAVVLLLLFTLLNFDRWDTKEASQRLSRFGRFARRHYLVPILIVALILLPFWALLLVEVTGSLLTQIDAPIPDDAPERRAYFTGIGLTLTGLGALLAAPFVIVRTWISERTTQAAEQGLITDRFTKAVEQLGAEKAIKVRERELICTKADAEEKRTVVEQEGVAPDVPEGWEVTNTGSWESFERSVPNLEVRLGGIYALERIAKDSERDHVTVMEVLCAYVRENAARGSGSDTPRVDIQAALTVIGRRSERQIELEQRPDVSFVLDLSHTNLQRANLRGAKLIGAFLIGANLSGAVLTRAKLIGAKLSGANLNWAFLVGANLIGANLTRAKLIGANLNWANLSEAKLTGANLESADLSGWSCARSRLRSTDFNKCRNLDPASVNTAFGVTSGIGRTILPDGMPYPEHWHEAAEVEEDGREHMSAFDNAYRAWLKTLPEED